MERAFEDCSRQNPKSERRETNQSSPTARIDEMNHHAETDSLYYPVSKFKMTRGEGIYLYDDSGREYIDCASATFNLSLGYSNKAVLSAMRSQLDELIHITSNFQSNPVNTLASKLLAVSPPNMRKVHPKVCGGSVANEGAIKMAQHATGRTEVISLFRSHLGQTMMMTSMSGNSFRRAPFSNIYPGTIQVPDPYCFRCFYGRTPGNCGYTCVDKIDDFLEYASNGRVAAIIVEPISGNGGNIVPPRGYFQKLRTFCDDHDIILIFDEIQTGIGRTGYMFAAEYFGVEPDAITSAKGLGGTGAQIAAIITNERLAGLPSHHHSFTYGSNLLAAAAANATLDIVSQPEFLANVRATGAYILERLDDMQRRYRSIVDVRGVGLMIGFELATADGAPAVAQTNALADAAMKYGLILRTSRYGYGNVLKIRPPLILTMDEAETICDRLETLFECEEAP
ncbi:aspartate aminotransferase family protein [Bradyrhizobium jicamae]|uniref:aspartate aminotransferase family protein n=1 Tax=Bradyrhizobium jicamae TaxID=280332 RepID=UPI001BA91B0A|nr:aspartate aminotransferase family protein [Bradyrhizobium jicamae]